LTAPWTEVGDLVQVLQKRWDRGVYLAAYAQGLPWAPVSLPVRSPTSSEILDRFDAVRRWAAKFEDDARTTSGQPRFRIEYRTVKGKNVGTNQVPVRIWVESLEQMCSLAGRSEQLGDLQAVLDLTRDVLPAAVPWVVGHPLDAVAHRHIWPRVLSTVAWVAERDPSRLYLRQLDVNGVDTKFVEHHQRLLDQVLSAVLPPERVDVLAPPGDFARRFRFRSKPYYARFRFLWPQPSFPAGVTEVRLRAEEVPAAGIEAATVFIVENEISYLAFPDVPHSVVMFGSGYALEAANARSWLQPKEVVYWGDIDTHGFAILSNLRARLTRVVSLLMDKGTLLAHAQQWVTEPVPISRPLEHLTDEERSVYKDLVEDRYGRSVRLEQERTRFSLVSVALAPWAEPSQDRH